MTIAKLYGQFLVKALNAEIDWDTHDIRVMLCTALTIDQDGDVYLADVTRTECAATGNYTAGGKQITFSSSTAIAYNATGNVITLDADDVVWDNSTITANYAIIYDNTPATNKPVIGYIDFEGAVSSVTGAFTVAWNGSGIATVTVS